MRRQLNRHMGALTLGAIISLAAAGGAQAAVQQTASAAQDGHAAAHAADYAASVRPDNAAFGDRYVIGINDVVAISVWKDAELSRTMPVRPDGKISLPVIGDVQAAGLTTLQLQAAIVAKLNNYVLDPQVNVIVEEVRSRTFNVMGKVIKPGSFDLAKPTTVLDAIAMAGGFQEYARISRIYVLRSLPGGSQQMLRFDYKAVIRGKRPQENIQIQPGDTVVVP
jgi:polysaccharide export outer membrane protein